MGLTTGTHPLGRGANAVPEGEESGGWCRGRSCSRSCSGCLKMSTTALWYANHFPHNLPPIPRAGRLFFRQVSPKGCVHHKPPPAKSDSLMQRVLWEAPARVDSLPSLRWVRKALKKGICPFSVMERQSTVLNFAYIRLGILTGDPAGCISATNPLSGGLRHPEDCKV